MVIALDGPSGTGKSTLSKLLAKRLGFKLINTGMIYRSITHYLLKQAILPETVEKNEITINNLNIEVKFIGDEQRVIINGVDCTPYVNDQTVQKNVSLYSKIPIIRKIAVKIQHSLASTFNTVVEGRDVGTEVFPNAEHKFYVVCNMEVRAKRRFEDLKKENQLLTLDEVIDSLKKRDLIDSTREISPLKKADDAIIIDTSYKTIEQSLNEIISYIK